MRRIILNKKTVIIFIFILGIRSTLAFFTSTISIPNIFTSLKYETTTTEDFTSPSNWKPGDVTPKTVITTNNSTVPIRVRISVEESWTDKNNNSLPLAENNTLAAIINLDNRQDWIYENGYYYFKYDVEPGDATNSFIKSVTFNKDIVGEYVCTTSSNSEQCDSASDTYQDATYKLDIKVETTPADNYLESWGLSRAPRRVAPTYCTFEGELVPGAEYVNGQFTYRYKQKKINMLNWGDIEDDGWGVDLTDYSSTDPVTSPLCTYINNKPIVATDYLFCRAYPTAIDTSTYDTTEIKTMNYMFGRCVMNYPDIEIDINLSNFETSNVIEMNGFFSKIKLDSIDISSFDTSNVTTMQYMFYKTDIKNFDMSKINTSNVTNMSYMFTVSRLKNLDFSHFDTSNVISMRHMFSQIEATSLDLSSFDTSKVTNMTGMFRGGQESSNLEKIYVGNKWNTNLVTDSNNMFYNCTRLPGFDSTKIDVSMANTNGGYLTLKTS